MKTPRTLAFALAIVSMIPLAVLAQDAAIAGNGHALQQFSSERIQMVSMSVQVALGRGPALYDGTTSGADRAEYQCRFLLKNLTDQAVDILVGVPFDADPQHAPAQKSADWVFDYGFIALDADTTYHVELVQRQETEGEGPLIPTATWNMHFEPNEAREVSVQYHLPLSTGLVETRKPQEGERQEFTPIDSLLEEADLETAGFLTATGNSWTGNVENATFTVTTGAFERYLDVRGYDEGPALDLSTEAGRKMAESFPVRHPWWFRMIAPGGWKAIDGAVQWTFTNFKPKDGIGVAYCITQIPRLPEETGPFLDRIVRAGSPSGAAIDDLRAVRDVLLATYGKEPENEAIKKFADAQEWYAPKKNFSETELSKAQKAILQQVDDRIDALRQKPSNPH